MKTGIKEMKIYFAPLEGITGYVYRNAYHQNFRDADKYFIPFVVPHTKRAFNAREKNDLLPFHNEGMVAIPQVLTKSAEDFLLLAEELKALGYREININAGCPSGTVVGKNRGAGLLADLETLNTFLDGIFSRVDVAVSIKTRIGMKNPEEFYDLLKIYNSYPIHELIIHPRVREDYYKNKPNLDIYEYALEHSKNPIVYNGDLMNLESILAFEERFPTEKAVMIGRGILTNPGLIGEYYGEDAVKKEDIKVFHDCLIEGYVKEMGNGLNVLFKMKELWSYMGNHFEKAESYLKKIRKVNQFPEYIICVNELFRNCPIKEFRK